MRIILSIIAIFSVGLLSAQSTSNTQKTLLTKRTATWCPNCGTWGWDFAKELEQIGDNAILMRAHHSGDLESKVAQDITKNFDAVYQPEFYINEVRKNVGSTTWSSMVSDFKSEIESNSENPANVSFELEGSITDNTISSSVRVEFLNAVEGDYFLAVYVLEDSIVNNQSSKGQVMHNAVLRKSMSGESFGREIVSGAASAGTNVSRSQSLDESDDPLGNRSFRLLAVVWKKVGEKYQVENLHAVNIERSSSINPIAELENNFHYSQVGDDVNIQFDLSKSYGKGQLILTSLDGKVLLSQSINADAGSHELSLNVNNPIPQIVLVSVSGKDSIIFTEKIFLY